MTDGIVEGGSGPYRFELRPAPRVTLHDGQLPRCDSNSPVWRDGERTLAFLSYYQPVGTTYRRAGGPGLSLAGPIERVGWTDDGLPGIGKWIESVWRHPATGRLHGWYHAEVMAPCERMVFVPRIGACVSEDDGLTWRDLGVILDPGPGGFDCAYACGFICGGYGDFSVVPDRAGAYLVIHFSSYVPDEAAQGIAVARVALADLDAPRGRAELWGADGWGPAEGRRPKPVFGVDLGWRHREPRAFWGPAVHFNADLDAWVMLLNRTERGEGLWKPEGMHVAFSPEVSDPEAWTRPVRLVAGGGWYPQVVGLGPDEGDALMSGEGRFFMEGASEATVRFSLAR